MSTPAADEHRWSVARRWRQYEAELRVNMVRIGAIGVFYAVHLVHHLAAAGEYPLLSAFGLQRGAALSGQRHVAVTAIAVSWFMLALLIHRLLSAQVFPRWLMYTSTIGDALLLTGVLALTSGARSPLVAGYFLIIMMAGLRIDLRLVRWTTACTLLSYLILLGCARWPIGLAKLAPVEPLPRYQQLMVLAALLLAGVVAGQWVRHARQLADDLIRAARQEADQ